MKKLIFIALLFAHAEFATATPVSFKDSWGVLPMYNEDWADLPVNYSLTSRYALGLSDYYREGRDSTANFGIGQANYLVKRWNEMDSQANVYVSLGLGGRHDSVHGDGLAGYGSFEANYETRRVYTVLAAETLQSNQGVYFNRIRYRAGISPYLAPFDALQTWLVVEFDYMPEMKDETRVTPLVRFFYNNYALEAGVSLDGKPFLAAMAHF